MSTGSEPTLPIEAQAGVPTVVAPAAEPALVEVLWYRKVLLLAGLTAGLLAGTAYFLSKPITYESKTQLLVVKQRADNPNGLVTAVPADDYMATQVGIIQSPMIVARAVKEKQLGNLRIFQGSARPVDDLVNALKVKRDPKDRSSQILEISFRGTDPKEVQQVQLAIVEVYQKFLKETYQNVGDETVKLINQARDTLEKDLATKEKAYVEFRKKNPSVFLKGGQAAPNLNSDHLMTLPAKKLSLQTRRAELQDLLAVMERELNGKQSREVLMAMLHRQSSKTIQDGGRSSTSTVLEAQLMPALLAEKTLTADYADNHPLVRQVRNKIELGIKSMKEIVKRELEDVKSAEYALDETYKQQSEAVARSASAEVEDEVFRDDLKRTHDLYDTTLKRLQEINVVKDLGGYEAQVIGPPGEGERISQSKPTSIFLGGALGGLMGGIGLALMLGGKKSPSQAGAHESEGRNQHSEHDS